MKKIKKNINKKRIDPIFEARKNSNFEKYSKEADIKIRIAEEVFFMRENRGLSQQVLAKNAETTQRVISNIENGDLNPGTFLLFKISKALNFNSHNLARIYDCSESFYVMNKSTGTLNTYMSKSIAGFSLNNN